MMAAVAVAAAATVASAYMQSQALQEQGQAAENAANYNNQVAQANAKASTDAAAVNEEDAAYRAKLLLGTEKASAGASGVDPNEGSPLAVMDTTTQQSTLDALKIRYGGATQSAAWVNQGQLDLMQGAAEKSVADTQSTAAMIGGIGSAASIYTSGARYQGLMSSPGP